MVLERVVAIQIEHYFESNGLLGAFQFGFRKNKSTISELLTLFDTLLEAKNERKEILLLLYDLSAAFDCISHNTLIEKMKIYGFNDHAIGWLHSYLENRQQLVALSGKMSKPQHVETGTPQGSRLSPLYLHDVRLGFMD